MKKGVAVGSGREDSCAMTWHAIILGIRSTVFYCFSASTSIVITVAVQIEFAVEPHEV